MTKTEEYKSMPKSIETFLKMSEKKRKEEYEDDAPKYYARSVQWTLASLKSLHLAFNKLPDKYIEKIDFGYHYDAYLRSTHTKEWIKDPSEKLIQRTEDYVTNIRHEIAQTILEKKAGDDFDNVLLWLNLIKKCKKKKIDLST